MHSSSTSESSHSTNSHAITTYATEMTNGLRRLAPDHRYDMVVSIIRKFSSKIATNYEIELVKIVLQDCDIKFIITRRYDDLLDILLTKSFLQDFSFFRFVVNRLTVYDFSYCINQIAQYKQGKFSEEQLECIALKRDEFPYTEEILERSQWPECLPEIWPRISLLNQLQSTSSNGVTVHTKITHYLKSLASQECYDAVFLALSTSPYKIAISQIELAKIALQNCIIMFDNTGNDKLLDILLRRSFLQDFSFFRLVIKELTSCNFSACTNQIAKNMPGGKFSEEQIECIKLQQYEFPYPYDIIDDGKEIEILFEFEENLSLKEQQDRDKLLNGNFKRFSFDLKNSLLQTFFCLPRVSSTQNNNANKNTNTDMQADNHSVVLVPAAMSTDSLSSPLPNELAAHQSKLKICSDLLNKVICSIQLAESSYSRCLSKHKKLPGGGLQKVKWHINEEKAKCANYKSICESGIKREEKQLDMAIQSLTEIFTGIDKIQKKLDNLLNPKPNPSSVLFSPKQSHKNPEVKCPSVFTHTDSILGKLL